MLYYNLKVLYYNLKRIYSNVPFSEHEMLHFVTKYYEALIGMLEYLKWYYHMYGVVLVLS